MRQALFVPLFLLATICCAYGLLIAEAAYIESQNRYVVSDLSHDLSSW
jgi:hypothetical protein